MSDEKLMDGYEAAVKARDENCLVCHADVGYGAEWRKGKLLWLHGGRPVSPESLEDTCWHVVEKPDKPGPPEGCELWRVESVLSKNIEENMPDRNILVVHGPELCDDDGLWMQHEVERDFRFRGWGYVVGGELKISAIPIAYTDGDRLVGNKNAFQDDVIRPDYAVMAKEEGDHE